MTPSRYQDIDSELRIRFSRIYRLIIILYAWYIIFTDSVNSFKPYDYVAFTALYGVIYWNLRDAKGPYSLLRQILDFTFIFLVLYKKDIFDIKHIIFCFLPLFNYANHSNIKRNPFLSYLLAAILIFSLKYQNLRLSDFLPFLFLMLIDFLEHFRTRVYHLKNSLLRELDKMLIKNIDSAANGEIYKEFIKYVNGSKFAKVFKVSDVICFEDIAGEYRLVNSHEFIGTMTLDVDQLHSTSVENFKEAISLVTNEKEYNNYVGLFITTEHSKYVFLLRIDVVNMLVHWLIRVYLYENLLPAFVKIANYIETSQDMKRMRFRMASQLKSNLGYINDAVFALHFVRNKLNPLVNYFHMEEEMQSIIDDNIMSFYDHQLKQEKPRARASLNMILERANNVLDMKVNSMFISNPAPMEVTAFITMLRTIWYVDFEHDSFKAEVTPSNWEKKVMVDANALEVLFSDITSNIKKYRNLKQDSLVSIKEGSLEVRFTNDLKADGNNIQKFKRVASDFTTNKILQEKQTTHGLTFIKTFLNQMNVSSSIEVSGKQCVMSLKFKLL